MAMTDEQIERYSRHIILKEVGAKGQKKLLKGKVLIIGAGGLGAPAAMYLAAAGVGTIGIVDADEVDLSNLQRQIIHSTADIGKAKVKSAKETMNAMNPDIEVKTYRMFVDASNIRELIQDVIHKKESEPHFECESVRERIRVPFDCILFAEQRGKSICLHMDDGKELIFRGKLDDEINKFPEKYFFRCHKSFLVNLSKICGIDRELLTFVMQGGEQVHIHRQGFFAAKRAYEHYLFSIAEGRKQEGQGADE